MRDQRDPLRSAFVRVLVPVVLLIHVLALGRTYTSLYGPSDGYTLANGALVGGDFVAFYQAGQTVRSDPRRLYDWEDFASRQQAFFRQHGVSTGILVFAYPPLVALAFSAFAGLSLLHAYLAWTSLSLLLFLFSVWIVFRSLSAGRLAVLQSCLAALGFFVFSLFCLAAGQTSAVGAFVFCAVFVLVSRRYDFCAGLVLAMSYYKPPLFVGFVLVLLFARHWRILGGFALGATVLLGATLLSVGAPALGYYISQASRYRYGQTLVAGASLPIDKGVGLLAAIEGLRILNGTAAQLALFVLTLVGAFLLHPIWREFLACARLDDRMDAREELLVTYSLLVSFSLLVSLQMVVYDLSILFPFGAASMYVLLRRRCTGKAMAVLTLATIGLYYEFEVRSVPVGSVVIKGTTLLWVTWSLSLAWLLRRVRGSAVHPVP